MAERNRLLNAAKAFCEAFGRGEELPVVLSHFCKDAYILEHGLPLPQLPYLGKKFTGIDEDGEDTSTSMLADYFKLVGKYLNIENEPVWGGWSIDCGDAEGAETDRAAAIVSCKGEATFLNRRTGKK